MSPKKQRVTRIFDWVDQSRTTTGRAFLSDLQHAPNVASWPLGVYESAILAIEAEAAPDLRADVRQLLEELLTDADIWEWRPTLESRVRAALAAPAADGLDVRLTAARLVAEHWRDEAMKNPQAPIFWGAVAHACAMVLAALDGETDPRQLGITEAKHAAFRDALHEPSREPGEEG